jgi:hypothetical protein
MRPTPLNFHARMGGTNNENPRLGSKHETIGAQREPTQRKFFGEGPGTVVLQKKGVPGAFSFKLNE